MFQERVYQELNEIFKGSDRPCTFQDTLEMKYLERVIFETLRLFPPVPAIARLLKEDVRIGKLYTYDTLFLIFHLHNYDSQKLDNCSFIIFLHSFDY